VAERLYSTEPAIKGSPEKHEFQAETRMLLDIVAKSLYSEKEVINFHHFQSVLTYESGLCPSYLLRFSVVCLGTVDNSFSRTRALVSIVKILETLLKSVMKKVMAEIVLPS
jgi:hypothetical protein